MQMVMGFCNIIHSCINGTCFDPLISFGCLSNKHDVYLLVLFACCTVHMQWHESVIHMLHTLNILHDIYIFNDVKMY